MPGLHQGIDDQAGWPLDGDGQFSRLGHALEPGYQVGQPRRIVSGFEADDNPTSAVDDADGMAGAAPIQTSVKWHVPTSSGCGRLTRAGR